MLAKIVKWASGIGIIFGAFIGAITIASAMDLPVRWWPWRWEQQALTVFVGERQLLDDEIRLGELKDKRFYAQQEIDQRRQRNEAIPKYLLERVTDLETQMNTYRRAIQQDQEIIKKKSVE